MQAITRNLLRACSSHALKPISRRDFFFRPGDPFNEAFRQLERTARDLDRVVDRALTSSFPEARQWSNRFAWPLDWSVNRSLPIETAADGTRLYSLRLHLPGFKSEDIQVNLKDNCLSIRAKHTSETNATKELASGSEHKPEASDDKTPTSRLVREYTYEHHLPDQVDVSKLTCKHEPDGCLLIQAPLLQPVASEAEQSKQIPIKRE